MIYLMKDMIYGCKNFIQQMMWFVKHYLKRNLRNALRKPVTSREQTMYTEETFGWEEPTTSKEVSASDRVNNRKEVTRREEPNTLNNKEVCKVSSDI